MKHALFVLPALLLVSSISITPPPATDTDVIVITDADLNGGTTTTWTNDNTYILDGYVYLEAGGILNVEPGTRIEGRTTPSNGFDAASALIITRDAQIFAQGTANAPIVFTAEGDDGGLDRVGDRGSWGGLIILGNAIIGEDGGVENIPGIPLDESERMFYGGTNNADNSGVLNYVSIRYGGAILSPGNEINGLTLGGVGSGTTIDYVEVFANLDDGIQIFGGAVDIKHAAVAFCSDEMYDTDEAWAGRGQYWFGIQGDEAPSGEQHFGAEHQGAETDDFQPSTVHTVFNATFIGMGEDSVNTIGNSALYIHNNAAAAYHNSIFTEFGDGGIFMESPSTERYLNTEFQLLNNMWFNFGDGPTLNDIINVDSGGDQAIVVGIMLEENNTVVNPALLSISRRPDRRLDPRLTAGSPALSGAATPSDSWFDVTTYRGAFDDTDLWLWGWTALDELGYLAEQPAAECVIITDDDLRDGSYNWVADSCYLLDGLVFLEPGGTLTIEAGTLIQGRLNPTSADSTSALIISSGATIIAQGTAADPIIFTAENDDLSTTVDYSPTDGAQWGGLAVLGAAPLEAGVLQTTLPDFASGPRTDYGGTDPLDSSGALQFIRIQHAGQTMSSLFLGGVGEGTSIDHIEVFADGSSNEAAIQLSGGTVNPNYLAVHRATHGDLVSLSNNWQGIGQFWLLLAADTEEVYPASGITVQGAQNDKPFYNTAALRPQLYNLTILGPEAGGNFQSFDFGDRASTQGGLRLQNSVCLDFSNGLTTTALPTVNYDIALDGNLFWRSTGAPPFAEVIFSANKLAEAILVNRYLANDNQIIDPGLQQPIRSTGPLDLRPAPSGAAASISWNYPDNDQIVKANFSGAFCSDGMWVENWTGIAEHEIVLSGEGMVTDIPESCQLEFGDIVLLPGTEVVLDLSNGSEEQATGLIKQLREEGARLIDSCVCIDNRALLRYYGIPPNDTIILDGPKGSSGDPDIDTVNVDLVLEPLLPADGDFTECDLPIVFQQGETDTVFVALLDTGMDLENERLASFIFNNNEEPANGVDDNNDCIADNDQGTNHIERDELPQDDLDHGTPLASIMTRLLPDKVQPMIMNEKVYNLNGGNAFELTCGLREAVDNGAQVVNISLGFWDSTVPIPLYNALKFAENKGVLVVVSAGNESENLADPSNPTWQGQHRWPGSFRIIDKINPDLAPFSNLIVAAALDASGSELAYYSNYDPAIVNVLTQGAFRTIGLRSQVVDLAGTSMTAAFVSRIAALALAYNPLLRPQTIIRCLTDTNNLVLNPAFDPFVSTGGSLDLVAVHKCLGIPLLEEELDRTPPQEVHLSPNPFYRAAHFRLGDGFTFYTDLELKIYDLCGELVYEEICNSASIMQWNGNTVAGTEAPDGLYLYDLRVNGKPFCGKVLKFWRN